VDELLEPEFLEKQIELGKKIKDFPNDSEIKEVYEFGLQLLQQHNFKIQDADADVIESPKKKRKLVSKDNQKTARQIIEYFNAQAETTFVSKGSNVEYISARLEEGYTMSDFKIVIDKKVKDWKGTDWAKYLRPITLFSKTKFENYLNGISTTEKSATTSNFSKFRDSVARAQAIIGIRTE
jgi:uncharacterized phage protein (TIGR02220 family)